MSLKSLFEKSYISLKKIIFEFFYSTSLFRIRVSNNSFIKYDKLLSKFSKELKRKLIEAFTRFDNEKDEAIARSQNFIEKKEFNCLGFGKVKIDENLDWHNDYFHDYRWDEIYFNKIDFVSIDERSDVKIPWEMSRFQYLLYLAEGHILDRENKNYLLTFCKILNHWDSKNKTGHGINWAVSMEVSIRLVNICLSLIIFWEDLDKEYKNKYLNLIFEHLRYLKIFPEKSDVSGNHHLAGLMGIFIVESIFNKKESDGVQKSFLNFCNEAKLQFEDSGIHFERSPTYHRLCIDMIGHVLMFSERAGLENEQLIEIFQRGNNFSRMISNHKGLLPVFGDNDSGHITWFGRNARDFSNNEAFLNIILKKRNNREKISSDTIWMSSVANINILLQENQSDNNDKKTVFSDGGFMIIKDKRMHSVMRVGDQGLKGRASHDHDDSLSLWLSFKGEDFLVEKGCHSYTLDQDIRLDYLTSQGHNLIQPINRYRSEPSQGSIVKTVRGANLARKYNFERYENDRIKIIAEINSTNSKRDTLLSHTRKVITQINKNKLTVEDDLKWRKDYIGDQRWHFESAFKPKVESKNIISVYKKEKLFCKIEIASEQPFKIDIFGYSHSFNYGSCKNAFGARIIYEKAQTICSKSIFTFNNS